MPCDRKLKPRQTIQERATEIREVVARLNRALVAGTVKPIIGPQGAIAFQGLSEADRDGVGDNCAYRRLLATASPLALAAIARAEQMAGRSVDKRVIGQGAHAHSDGKGGLVWHDHKG